MMILKYIKLLKIKLKLIINNKFNNISNINKINKEIIKSK